MSEDNENEKCNTEEKKCNTEEKKIESGGIPTNIQNPPANIQPERIRTDTEDEYFIKLKQKYKDY